MTANTTAESWPEIQRPTSRPLSARLQHCGKKIFSTMTSAQCSDYSSSDDLRTRRKEHQVRWPLHVFLLSTKAKKRPKLTMLLSPSLYFLIYQPSLRLYWFLLKIKIFHLTNILFCFLRRSFFYSNHNSEYTVIQWICWIKNIISYIVFLLLPHDLSSCEILLYSSIS